MSLSVIEQLAPFMSEHRRERIEEILRSRTYSITPVLDTIYDEGNISAVMRSAEILGYQSLHLIRSEKTKASSRIALGSEKWVELFQYRTRGDCINCLQKKGYRLVATSLAPGAVPLDEIDVTTRPMALIFGNEKEGVNREILEVADEICYIPSVGFTESFNISVAVGIALYSIYKRRMEILGKHGDLLPEDIERLRTRFYTKSVKHSDQILKYITKAREQ
ncbi:MAG: RNA methyltransferase [Oligoflexia bacterium]|nr:RNA methyltransferase [Oligoflexia bacterium]